jgi:hypothetical protein
MVLEDIKLEARVVIPTTQANGEIVNFTDESVSVQFDIDDSSDAPEKYSTAYFLNTFELAGVFWDKYNIANYGS